MIIVGTDEAAVERDLLNGPLNCPNCGSGLRPWGHGIERDVRLVATTERRRFRRSICRSCASTHVLVHEDTLVRRRDGAEVIGMAFTAKARTEYGHGLACQRSPTRVHATRTLGDGPLDWGTR